MSDIDSSASRRDRERDLILGPGEYANILDETKGHVSVWVGPAKASLSQTDRPVRYKPGDRRFVECRLEDSILTFPFAEKGSYIVLHNPVDEPKNSSSEDAPNSRSKAHPNQGSNNTLGDLAYGSKINIEGPQSFALFPGQYAETIGGHRMRSNQYLIVRVYDEDAAKENWSKATIKLQKKEGEDENPEEATEEQKAQAMGAPDLTMGRLLVIEGTLVSFYIPPTGIEVVKDEHSGGYVREAVTLERLEYCILLDEDGNKRYVQGPAVVFPKPTETFVSKNDSRKFKAIELNDLMGLYVKVIADYTDGEDEYHTGDELFITGKDQKIYYPRPEHAIVKYGKQMVNYAIAIPPGEARYVLNRDTGEIALKRGPAMFLPDPRREVIVRRVLSDKEVALWFPGNQEAAIYNDELVNLSQDIQEDMMDVSSTYVPDRTVRTRSTRGRKEAVIAAAASSYDSVGLAASEELKRRDRFTPPRTITIDTKYEGAVTIDVWPGYAVQVVSKTGERKVIVGPEVYLLEYDETLEKMSFSTGTPKSDKHLKNDAYLRVLHNTISDMIRVETKDLCPIDVVVSYRVNFEGAPKNWFSVENPVKFLTDHLRSVLRNKVKQLGIEEFYNNSIDIIRDTILGEHNNDGERAGRPFKENGMKVYDLEVLGVSIEDGKIADLLERSQHDAVQKRLMIEQKMMELETTEQVEKINQKMETAKSETVRKRFELKIKDSEAELKSDLADLKVETEVEKRRIADESMLMDTQDEISQKKLAMKVRWDERDLHIANEKIEQTIKELNAEAEVTAAKAQAISPQLMEVLAAFANKDLAGKLAENLNVLSILGGGKKSVVEIAQDLLGGTGIAEALKNINLHGHVGNLKGVGSRLFGDDYPAEEDDE